MNGPVLHVKRCKCGEAAHDDGFLPVKDVARLQDHDDCTYVHIRGGGHIYTHTPAAEIMAEIDRLRAEPECDPSRVSVDAALWRRKTDERVRYFKALVDILNHYKTVEGQMACYVEMKPKYIARDALMQPAEPELGPVTQRHEAIALVDKWLADTSGYDEATWPRLQAVLCPLPEPEPDPDPEQEAFELGEAAGYAQGVADQPEPEPTPDLDGWKAEFYPVSAESVKGQDDVTLIEHSLRKWRGALPENLKRYGLSYKGHTVFDGDQEMRFNTDTCTLCVAYYTNSGGRPCPLGPCPGHARCVPSFGDSINDPRPMIVALEGALAARQAKPEPTQLERLREKVRNRIAHWEGAGEGDFSVGRVSACKLVLEDLYEIAMEHPDGE